MGMIKNSNQVSSKSRKTRLYTVNNRHTLTEQHHKASCDAGSIVAKYGMGIFGTAPESSFKDLSNSPNLQEKLKIFNDAKYAYETLPEELRKQFDHPYEFFNWLQDEKNLDKMKEYGLVDTEYEDWVKSINSETPTSVDEPKEPSNDDSK